MKGYGGFESAQAYSIVMKITRVLKMISYEKMGEQLEHFCHKRARHDCRAEKDIIWLDNC